MCIYKTIVLTRNVKLIRFSVILPSASICSCQIRPDLAAKWRKNLLLFISKSSDWLSTDKHHRSLTRPLTHCASSLHITATTLRVSTNKIHPSLCNIFLLSTCSHLDAGVKRFSWLVLCHTLNSLTSLGTVGGSWQWGARFMEWFEAHCAHVHEVWPRDASGFGDRIVVTWQKQDSVSRWHHATSVSLCWFGASCRDGQQAFWWFFLKPNASVIQLYFSG